jgi:transporter family-2 protein
LIVLAIAMGAILSICLPMNSSVARHLDSTFLDNVIFFWVALETAIIIFLIFGNTQALTRFGSVPPYLYLTGFISAFFILGTALLVSHFGILESPKDPVTLKKVTGSLVVILGAYISTS